MKRRQRILSILLVVSILALPLAMAFAESFQSDLDGIELAAKSVLLLEVHDKDDHLIATGSGFVAFDNSTLVTNYHVIEDADWILGISDTGSQYKLTKVIAANQTKDIALLEFEVPADLEPLPLASGEKLRRGAPVVTIGSPLGVANSVSLGNISALYEEQGVSLVQFTAPISPGSSGGALFNTDGKVIGITSAYYIGSQNMNLAVDIQEVIALHTLSNGIERVKISDYVARPAAAPTFKPTATPAGGLGTVTQIRVAVTAASILLTWDAVPSAKSYRIYRSLTADGEYALIGTAMIPMFSDTEVTIGKAYYYKFQCVNGEVESELSKEVRAVMPAVTPRPTPTPTPVPTPTVPPAPPAPENVSASLQEGGAAIAWDKVASAQKYIVYRTVGSAGAYAMIGTTAEDHYFDRLSNPGLYFYKVQSVNADGRSDMSKAAAAEYGYTEATEVKVPKGVKAKASAGKVSLTWTAVTGAEKYLVYRADRKDGSFTVIASAKGLAYEDTDVVTGLRYYYRIRCVQGGSVSGVSNTVSVQIPKPTPTPRPTNTPKPTPTPYQEPKYPLTFGKDGYLEMQLGYPLIDPGLHNISQKETVTGFTLTFYCTDAYLTMIRRYGYGDYYSDYDFSKTIKPGKTVYPGDVWLDGYVGAKYVYVAVTKIYLSSGAAIIVPERDWDFHYWIME